MTIRRDRDLTQLVAVLVEALPQRPPMDVARAAALLVRHARGLHRLAEAESNVGLTHRQRTRRTNLQCQVEKAIARLNGDGQSPVKVRFNNDPRGYAVKLLLPTGKYNSWGGAEEGWGVPCD